MGMSVGSSGGDGDPDVVVEMNTTPLIDVMLVLLIMLIITIPIQSHAVKMDLPVGNPPPPPVPPPVVRIIVDFDGTITWDGNTVATEQDLVNDLRGVGLQPEESQPEIHLEPNKLATYGAVAHVMADAQRLGVKKLGVVGGY
ncbi:MAG TPA: biopolymer transporter ExbD [Acetobacteraceae bacterium]|nr:biopolymer transporter ExbD [Acetobacteraceae bacterium]